MTPIHKLTLKKKIIIAAGIFTGIIMLLLLIAFLYIHSLVKKINIVPVADQNPVYEQNTDVSGEVDGEYAAEDPQEADAESEDQMLEIPETPEEDITLLDNSIQKNLEVNQIPVKYDKDVFNILLIGSDTRKSGAAGRSDAILLVSVNKRTKCITVTSILRDIYLEIPGKEKNNRINTAYAFGGADLLMDTVEQNFKIKVDKYASIDFYAFIDIVDAVGGVTLEVTAKEIPVINNYVKEINKLTGQENDMDCLALPGTLLLNGKQALGFSRDRYIGNADFERTARQRQVLEQVYGKMKKLKLSQLKDLLNIILPQVTTNLTEGEIFSLILSLPTYKNYDVVQWSIPKAGTYKNMKIRGMAVLGIDFEKNIDELHSKLYNEN